MEQHTPEVPVTPPPTTFFTRVLSIGSNVLIGVLFSFLAFTAYYTWQATGHVQMLLLALQELFIVGLAITRRYSIEESRSPWDWFIALVGTGAPLLQRPGLELPIIAPIGLTIQIIGTFLALIATISLGRSFGIIAANRGVRTGGFYRFVRHPLYGSYLVGYIGFLLADLSIANLLLIILTILAQYLRAIAEERILSHDPTYRAYMQQVPYRFIPYVF